MQQFQETQRFTQWWVWALLIIVLIISIAPIMVLMKEDGYDTTLSWALIFPIAITLLVMLLFYFISLKTTIDRQGIHYQFLPFPKKTIPWRDINKCYVRTYKPFREYGGWGVRFGFSGKAYNVKGNKGIQLVLNSNKKILIGTQKETEAQNAIAFFTKNNPTNQS